jgi:hypothetical protein
MKKLLRNILTLLLPAIAITACSDDDSYSSLLADESKAVNYYLSNFPVKNSIPADTAFVTVQDYINEGYTREEALRLAPFYRLDEDGQIYMQVVNPGTEGNMVADGQLIYFRFTRYNLNFYYKYDLWEADGNSADLGSAPTSFRFGNTTLTSTTQWGTGVQEPLNYLPIDSEVNVIIKSAIGPTEEVASVYGYVYQMRYFPSKV